MSQRAMLAAAARVSAAAAPLVTIPASAPVIFAMARLAADCNSPMSTEARAAATIAATTSSCMSAPPSRVSVPAALMRRLTPSAYRSLAIGEANIIRHGSDRIRTVQERHLLDRRRDGADRVPHHLFGRAEGQHGLFDGLRRCGRQAGRAGAHAARPP